jgi:hypothetical protein
MFDCLHTQKHIRTYYNTQTHRHTDNQTTRHTDTGTQTHTDTDTDRPRVWSIALMVFGERLTANVAVEDAETASVRLWTGWFVIGAFFCPV